MVSLGYTIDVSLSARRDFMNHFFIYAASVSQRLLQGQTVDVRSLRLMHEAALSNRVGSRYARVMSLNGEDGLSQLAP